MPIRIEALSEDYIPGAITTIQQAFADDPYNHWVYDDRSKVNFAQDLRPIWRACVHHGFKTDTLQLDLNRNRVSLGIRCRWGIRNALFHVAKDEESDEVLGVAMWMPPRRPDQLITWADWAWSTWEAWGLWSRQVMMNMQYGRGGLNVKRYYIWKASQSAAQKELWADPRGYYFLNIMTVLPSQQGKGIGRALFEEITNRADKEGIKCYLESSKEEPNIKIYEAMGFKFVRRMTCDDGGETCVLFCMIREPRT